MKLPEGGVSLQVTELLYLKQTQLEKMAADKAAQQLALEREVALARDEAERVRRCDMLSLALPWLHC